MTETSDGQINSSPDFAVIDEAIREAMRDEVLSHAREGRSVPTFRDGRVIWITPEEILNRFSPSLPHSEEQPCSIAQNKQGH
ncbi:MAG: hypothetical protein WCJ09_28805 [Planctomycetota bacterium]